MTAKPTRAEIRSFQAVGVPGSLRQMRNAAMAGVSLLALGLGMTVLPAGVARAQDSRVVVNGDAGGGVILLDSTTAGDLSAAGYDVNDGILASGGFAADPDMLALGTIITGSAGDYSISDTIFTNFLTQGGAGSGGGGGLGGVIFVNSGVALTLTNVDFTRNTVVGGTGGSDPEVNLGTFEITMGTIEMPFAAISTYYFDSDIAGTETGGTYQYTVSQLTLTQPNPGLQVGMRVQLPGTDTSPGSMVTITAISPDKKKLTFEPVTLDNSKLLWVNTHFTDAWDDTNRAELTFSTNTNDLMGLEIGAALTLNGVDTGITVKGIDTEAGKVTLSKPLEPDQWALLTNDPNIPDPDEATATLHFLNFTRADVSQIKGLGSDGVGNYISVPGQNGFFLVGMVLSDDDPNTELDETGRTITDVVYDPVTKETRVYYGGAPLGSAPVAFDASFEQVTLGSNELKLVNSQVQVGMRVTGDGLPSGDVFVGSVDGGIVTLVDATGAAVKVEGVKPETLTFTGVKSVDGNVITFASGNMLTGVKPGMVVTGDGIPEGTKVVSVDFDGATVTLDTGGGSLSDVSELVFGSATSLGGSMNNLYQAVTGTKGKNGNNAWGSDPLFGDGEGEDGYNGGGGGDGQAGAGGAGGKGGNGSAGLFYNPSKVKDVADSTVSAILDTLAANAAFASFPPDTAEGWAGLLTAAQDYVNLGLDIAELAVWYVKFGVGNNAEGGDGGEGGYAGGGSDFFGGGVGGAGGNGGAAGNPFLGSGGDGGDGGRGGAGGFGGGGGMGGAGGNYGQGVMAPTNTGWGGLPGVGGFGGGKGANGDGYGGDGGAGFGGAIFVRKDGSLLITGNSTFDANGAIGGMAGEGGASGPAAGADLFMMKGSTVIINPGATGGVDNVVTFNGTIGDDSRETFVGAQYGSGQGAGLTIGKGLTIFNGRNTYSGQTKMEGGVLQADDGWGLNKNSNLNFNGAGTTGALSDNTNAGVLMTSGYFSRQLGTDGTKVQWTGSGGFAAKGGDLIVNIGNLSNSQMFTPQKLTWGVTPGFFTGVGGNAALVFGSEHADSNVYWLNPIELGALSRQIVVAESANGTEFARMEGVISGTGGGLIVGEAGSNFWTGSLVLAGKNTFTGDLDIRSGAVAIAEGGGLANGVNVIVAPDAAFHVMAADLTLGTITNGGYTIVGEDLKADGIDNQGWMVMMADIDLSPGFDGPGPFDGDFFNGPLARLVVVTNPFVDPDDAAHTLTVDEFYGQGTVVLGDPADEDDKPILTIAQRGESTFDGDIVGAGGLTLTAPAGAVNPASRVTLTGNNTYEGPTVIDVPSTLALKDGGHIAVSESVQVDGTFDISEVTTCATDVSKAGTDLDCLGVGTASTTGTHINDLSGASSGEVVLGDNLLIVDKAASTFAGEIWGAGDFAVLRGTQTLSGVNTYTGETYVLPDGGLSLVGAGSIAESVRVVVLGDFDISQTDSGASIRGLEGDEETATVVLGDQRLTITDANAFDAISPLLDEPVGSSFAGIISGTGGVTLEKGKQTLTNVNDYTGTTIIEPDGALHLKGNGSIAESESVTVDGIFDISETTDGTSIINLLGTDPTARIELGSKTLTLTGDGDSSYAGIIVGDAASGLVIKDGTLTLTNASPDYNGTTVIEEDATLFLAALGAIPGSSVDLAGVFDISAITTPNGVPGLSDFGTSILDLSGDGEIRLGANTLAVSDATGDTFSGPITGTGAFGVSGGLLHLDLSDEPTVNATIFAATGGAITVTGGDIDTTGSDRSALAVINGGRMDVTDTTLTTPGDKALASVLFTDAFDNTEPVPDTVTGVAGNPAYIRLGEGTVIENNGGPLLKVTRDGAGAALEGDVIFIIDNSSMVVGDILDEQADRTTPGGATDVYLGTGVNWAGRAVAGDFFAMGGSSAHFNSGSLLDNLTAMEGANISLSGNVNVLGTMTLHSNGFTIPGSSPGVYNVGTFVSDFGNYDTWITFGVPQPQPGAGMEYSQINVAGNFTGDGVGGDLAITLRRYNSTQSTPIVDLADFELLRIGGTEIQPSNVHLASRFTQNGRELLLDKRVDVPVDAALVAGLAQTEDGYFLNDLITVYGLRSIVQDETYGLGVLTGTIHQSGLDTLGSFLERRGSGELETTWGRAGAIHSEVNDSISSVQDLAFAQYGVDLVQMGNLRAGVLGSYTYSTSGVETETGTANLQGSVYSGGAYATWADNGAYIDVLGQYGFGAWTFSPTMASALTINSQTALASIEAGFRLGDDQASVTPWSQLVYETTFYDGLDSAWMVDAGFDAASTFLRGGVRAEATFGIFTPYADLSLTHNLNDRKTTTVDGFDITTGMGGTRVELGTGFQANLSDNAEVWTQVKGAYGQGEGGDMFGYQGQAGMHVTW